MTFLLGLRVPSIGFEGCVLRTLPASAGERHDAADESLFLQVFNDPRH